MSLELTGLDGSELNNAVNGVGVLDHTVISDHHNAIGLGLLKDGAELRAVNRAYNEHLGALLHHGFNLSLLVGNLVVSGLNDRLVASFFQISLEDGIGFLPVLGSQPWKRHANGGAIFDCYSCAVSGIGGRFRATAIVARAAAECKSCCCCDGSQPCETSFHCFPSGGVGV